MSPWYEYKCSICGEKFDDVKTVAEREHAVSPCCHDVFPKRLVSAGAFVIDGIMSTNHPNSPEGIQRTKEIKNKYWKKGKKEMDALVKETKARAKVDKKWEVKE